MRRIYFILILFNFINFPQSIKAQLWLDVGGGVDGEINGSYIDRIMARAQQDDVKKRLISSTEDAVKRGVFGSPTCTPSPWQWKNVLSTIQTSAAPAETLMPWRSISDPL